MNYVPMQETTKICIACYSYSTIEGILAWIPARVKEGLLFRPLINVEL